MSSLKNLAIRGGMWIVGGYGLSQIIRLGSNLILTRLLIPELFGLMALVNVFLQGLELFSDVGIRPNIVRNPKGEEPQFYNTAWTIQIIRGFILWLLCFIIAAPASQIYDEPRLLWLIPVVGLTTVIRGFKSTSMDLLSRRLEIGKSTRFQITNQIISLTITVVWAWFHRSIWALVVANLLGALLLSIRSHSLTNDPPNRLAWNLEARQEIFSFGKWIFISTAMTFLANQADQLLLGKLLGIGSLGVYSIARIFTELPMQIVQRLSNGVAFPTIVKKLDLPRHELREKILEKRKLLLLFAVGIITIFASFGDLVILFLYDERYTEASWMLPLLTLGIWPILLARTMEQVLIGMGKPYYNAAGYFLKFLYMITLLPFAYQLAGNVGAIIAVAFNDIPYYSIISFGLWKEKINTLRQDILMTFLLIVAIISIVGVRYSLGAGLPISQLIT